MQTTQIAIFASGNGSNAINIIDYFKENSRIEVVLLLSNKEDAPVVAKAKDRGVETMVLNNDAVSDSNLLIATCINHKVDYIILAGYLRKIPLAFTRFFDRKIINIHPSLLPKFGGKGMYGDFVHQAVVEGGEQETGITIHFVNAEFDKGEQIAQFSCKLQKSDRIDEVRAKVHELEMTHFPKVIEETILNSK